MYRLLILTLLLFPACHSSQPSHSGWQKVFQNDANGKSVFGDKTILLDAVRLGYPIRIGWGGNRVEHVADADFLTIFQGQEVFAQIKTIVGQAPRVDGDSLKIRFRSQNQWTKMVGTNGYATAFMSSKLNDSLPDQSTDRYSATTWYVLMPNHDKEIEARPLWRSASPLWSEWETSTK